MDSHASLDVRVPLHELFLHECSDENAPSEPTDISTIFESACSTKQRSGQQRRVTWDKGVQGRGGIGKARRPRLAFAPGKQRRNASEHERRRQAAVARYAVDTWDDIVAYVARKAAREQRDADVDAALAQACAATCGIAPLPPGAPLRPRAASLTARSGFPDGWPQFTGFC